MGATLSRREAHPEATPQVCSKLQHADQSRPDEPRLLPMGVSRSNRSEPQLERIGIGDGRLGQGRVLLDVVDGVTRVAERGAGGDAYPGERLDAETAPLRLVLGSPALTTRI